MNIPDSLGRGTDDDDPGLGCRLLQQILVQGQNQKREVDTNTEDMTSTSYVTGLSERKRLFEGVREDLGYKDDLAL